MSVIMVRMRSKRPTQSPLPVWQRKLVTIPELVADPDWPFARTATYNMAERGDIPTRRIGEHVLVVVPALVRQLDLVAEMAA